MVVVPFLVWVVLADTRHLPAGRSQVGDRHLNSHKTRDNLWAAVRVSSRVP